MGRSGKIIAKHDHLIEEIINDDRYDIREDGSIWTRVARTGKVFVDKSRWRRGDYQLKSSYYTIAYKGKDLQAHRVIYRKFNGPLFSDLVISHKDNNKSNNLPPNLKLESQAMNNKNTYVDDHRLPQVGHSKITFEKAEAMRKLYATGKFTYKDLMGIFGLTSKGTISGIINNKNWQPKLHNKIAARKS